MSAIQDTVKAGILLEDSLSREQYEYQLPKLTFNGLQSAQTLCHKLATRSGWWADLSTGEKIDANDPLVFGQKVALIHSEISEAMEGHRKNLDDKHLPHRKNVEVELADAMIRILDLAGAMELDLAGAMIEKLAVNQQRADHKPENRRGANGKQY